MRPELVAPEELRAQLEQLLPRLAERSVRKVEVFSDRRPGEGPFWVCFLSRHGRRYSIGTPDLRSQSLADQVPDLLRQLGAFDPPALPGRGVRTMMWLTPECQLPDFVTDAEYWPNDIVTATIPETCLDELQLHPGILSIVTHD